MNKKVYSFQSRVPSEPHIRQGIELQFYIRAEEFDVKEMGVDEEGNEVELIVEYMYYKKVLSWREEFVQQAEYDEEGVLTKEDYITTHLEALREEATYILKS